MNVTANESYDVVVIMDADNVTTPNFLAESTVLLSPACMPYKPTAQEKT